MHVMLRRKTGRVTDTEWLACNVDYAREIVRFSREWAQTEGDAELADLADKLALTLIPIHQIQTKPKVKETHLTVETPGWVRYVQGLR